MATSQSAENDRLIAKAVEFKFGENVEATKHTILMELASSFFAARGLAEESPADEDFFIAQKLIEQRARSLAAMEYVWDPIEEILASAEQSIGRWPDDGKAMERWRASPVTRLDGAKDVDDSASIDDLGECAFTYCRSQWANSPTLELWLIRKMIYAETFAYAREVGIPIPTKGWKFWWTWAKTLTKWLIGVAVAVSIADRYGGAAGVLAYVAWMSLTRFLLNDRIANLLVLGKAFAAMRTTYVVAMRGRITSPTEIERHAAIAEGLGAVWPTGLRALLETAKSRGRLVWP